MCDYSLHAVASRPARLGDHLVTTKFRQSSTRGFSAPEQLEVAVCLMPGTEVAFDNDVEYSHAFRRLLPGMGFGQVRQRLARFRHVSPGDPHVHHDALEFPDGKVVLLTQLCPGQHARVLQLPAELAPTRRTPEHAPASADA